MTGDDPSISIWELGWNFPISDIDQKILEAKTNSLKFNQLVPKSWGAQETGCTYYSIHVPKGSTPWFTHVIFKEKTS